MSKLQELLDARWPITPELIPHQKMMNEMLRNIFTEGYNAAIQVAKDSMGEDYSWNGTWEEAKNLYNKQGMFSAIRYLRHTGRKESLYDLSEKIKTL